LPKAHGVKQQTLERIMIKTLARWTIWPLLMTAFLASFAWTQAQGFCPGTSILAITIGHITVIALIETWLPARREWAWWTDRQSFNDIAHSLLLDAGVRLGNAVLLLALAQAGSSLAAQQGAGMWPDHWPFLLQLAAAILIYDFCDYWKHRAFHGWRWAWPIHFVHHNPDRMHVLKAGRLHFLEAAIRTAIVLAPLVLLGAPAEIFFWLAALANAFGGQNHWNVDARLPRWLHWLVATPDVHWVHHDQGYRGTGANFSPYTMTFDHLFGTYRDPAKEPVGNVGVAGESASGNLIAQLLRPLLPAALRRYSEIRSASSLRPRGRRG
jgi:ornithine lipid hydroxylase